VNPLELPTEPLSGPRVPTIEQLDEILTQYEVTDFVGRGGMGAVFKAVQTALDRDVAVKILPIGLAEEAHDLQFVDRFKQEAKAMAKLDHPSIVHVHDSGEVAATGGRLLYFVMEFIEGSDVRQYLKEKGGKLRPDEAHSIISQVLDALSSAHERGIIHRDIKPANILLDRRGRVKVADFGVAKALGAGGNIDTKPHLMIGTPDYVAPEALDLGCAVDGRADLFAVGAMFYQLLTGKLPRGAFRGPADGAPDIDPRYNDIVLQALQPDPEDRYQSAEDFQEDMEHILRNPMMAPTEIVLSGQERESKPETSSNRQAPPSKGGTFLLRSTVAALFAALAGPLFLSADVGWLKLTMGSTLAVAGVAAMIGRPRWLTMSLILLSLVPLGWLTVVDWKASSGISALGPLLLPVLVPIGFLMATMTHWKTAGWTFLRLALVFGFAIYGAMMLGLDSKFSLPVLGELPFGKPQFNAAKSYAMALYPDFDKDTYPLLLRSLGIATLVGCAGIWSRFTVGFSALLLSLLSVLGLTAAVLKWGIGSFLEWWPDFLIHLTLPVLAVAVWRLVNAEFSLRKERERPALSSLPTVSRDSGRKS
tara:strand:+ start:12335 stop:14107 length:1773 start_codon:yes stop_codon:yes gene_type:complete